MKRLGLGPRTRPIVEVDEDVPVDDLELDVEEALATSGLEVRFRELAAGVAEGMSEIARVEDGEDDLAMKVFLDEVDGALDVNLHAVFQRTRDCSPQERQAELVAFFRALVEPLEIPEDWGEAKKLLIPLVRGHHHLGLDSATIPRLGIQRPFVSPMAEFIAVRGERGLGFPPAGDASERWGRTQEEVFEQGRANLALLCALDEWSEREDGILMLRCSDVYAASRLLLRSFWESLTKRVDGEQPVVISPEQSQVLAARSQDVNQVRRLLEIADREYGVAERRVSSAVYSITPEMKVFMMDGHNLDEMLSYELQLRAVDVIHSEYDWQAKCAQQQQEGSSVGAFVPSTLVLDTEDGHASSALLLAGCETLMPDVGFAMLDDSPTPEFVTDEVGKVVGFREVAGTERNKVATYWWPDVKEHFGTRLQEEPGWDPPRYRMTPSMVEEMVSECQRLGTPSDSATNE